MATDNSVNKGLYWTVKSDIWKAFGTLFYGKRNAFMVDLLSELKQGLVDDNSSELKLLDIGCGIGDITEKISDIYNLETIGVDLNKWFLTNSRAIFLIADSCVLPFKPMSFSVVTAFSLLEHIEEDCRRGFYTEIRKVLTDGGIFAIQLPNRYFLIEQHSFLPFVGYLPSRLHKLFYYDYVSVPSLKEIIKELTNCGFSLRIVKYGIPFQGFPLNNLISKVLPFGFIIIAKKRIQF